MRTQTHSPTRCASRSRHCASASANHESSPPWPASHPASTRHPAVRERIVDREPGLSVRLKLTLSYAGFLMLAAASLLAAVWVFLLRYVPDRALIVPGSTGSSLTSGVFPIRSNLLHVFAPRAAAVLAFLLVCGLVGG